VIAYTCKYWNLSVVSAVFIEIFQHNQQYDTLLHIIPCTHKLKAGIAHLPVVILSVIFLISYRILKVLFTFYWKQTKMYSISNIWVISLICQFCSLPSSTTFGCKENETRKEHIALHLCLKYQWINIPTIGILLYKWHSTIDQ
jgi:hypothetical protein